MNVPRFLLKRLGLSLITLWILSVIVFLGGQLLPGDVGRAILGPLADARAVAALDHQIGSDRPLLTQYVEWIGGVLTGDLGMSYVYRSPVAPFIGTALLNSLKLAAEAFVIVVPLSLFGGVVAALRVGKLTDRIITTIGSSLSTVPEYVSSIAVILIFGITLNWLPISATWPDGSGALTQIYYLFLPSMPLAIVLFGYIARMARTGTVEALDADYTRTAVLKGLSTPVVLWRHVLRNALIPTITVIASQTGYMIGGLVVVEDVFHYQGIGGLIYSAARGKDFPMLEAGVLIIGIVYTVATLLADIFNVMVNPRLRLGGGE
jgi:peptide/nickel transport system permease protein